MQTTHNLDYYQVIGVNRHASRDEILTAWKKAVREAHPDGSEADTERYRLIIEARATLEDPTERRAYDAVLKAQEEGATSEPPPTPAQNAPTNSWNAVVEDEGASPWVQQAEQGRDRGVQTKNVWANLSENDYPRPPQNTKLSINPKAKELMRHRPIFVAIGIVVLLIIVGNFADEFIRSWIHSGGPSGVEGGLTELIWPALLVVGIWWWLKRRGKKTSR